MATVRPWYRRDGEDLILTIQAQPRAKRDAIAGVHGDALKIQVKAAPADGRANAVLIALLAARFGVPRTSVVIERGRTARRKQVRVKAPQTGPETLPSRPLQG